MIKILGKIYRFMWMGTSQEPWTYIMRRNPVLLLVPGAGVFALNIYVSLNLGQPWGLLLGTVSIFVAFLSGHVFWGRKVTSLQEAAELLAYWREEEWRKNPPDIGRKEESDGKAW